jgi:hypothetical protein
MEQITFKFMVDFLNANRNRKIDLLKSHITNFQGLKVSEINNLVDMVTSHFSKSLAREMQRQRKNIQVNSKVGTVKHPIKSIIVR